MSAVPPSLAWYMHLHWQCRAPSRFQSAVLPRPQRPAVVELTEPIVFNENIRPIRLNTDPKLLTSLEVA